MTATFRSLPTIDLVDLDGGPATLQGQLGGRPAVVLAVRYYGCLPCQHYLVGLHRQRDELDRRNVEVVVVGVAADFQAQHLRDTYDITFPLLLDPDQNLYGALELPRMRPIDLLRPSTWRHYLPLFWKRYVTRTARGPRQGRIVGDPMQLPGIALVDGDGVVRWLHRGASLGDYPPIGEVLTRVDELGLATHGH
jgi:peroxiredoxin